MDTKKCLSTNTATQRKFILNILKSHYSFNTLEFRDVGICSPAPRIYELRNMGYEIDTYRITGVDSAGTVHPRIGQYVLMKEPCAEQLETYKNKKAAKKN